MTTNTTTSTTMTSPLRSLRSFIPERVVDFAEALQVAERQATRLMAVADALTGGDVQWEQVIGSLPRITVIYERLPVSGTSHWNGQAWVIALNPSDSLARQRFTLLHEFKHIVDHGYTQQLYSRSTSRPASFRRRSAGAGFTPAASGGASPSSVLAELAADYFAGCALVPKRELKRAWCAGLQRPDVLADHFGVSVAAIDVRLDQTGLAREADPEPAPLSARCARPIHTPRFRPQQFRTAHSGGYRRSFV